MNISRIELLLERIAVAVENIADTLDNIADSQNRVMGLDSQEKSNTDEPIEKTQNHINKIGSFLKSKSIQIKSLPDEDAADYVINGIAVFMGDKYSSISRIYKKIKREMQHGGTITEHLANETQRDISNICQFCTRLYETAFLEEYKYFRAPRYLIKAKTTTLPRAQNFLSGQWLERYILENVKESVSLVSKELSKALSFSYLINPKIILPNGNDFELDVIFEVEGIFYWVEAKTGDYQQHINKYSNLAKTLNLDYKHSLMVLTDINPSASESLSALFSMSVCQVSEFPEFFRNLLFEDHTK
jgi:hypothetical protein